MKSIELLFLTVAIVVLGNHGSVDGSSSSSNKAVLLSHVERSAVQRLLNAKEQQITFAEQYVLDRRSSGRRSSENQKIAARPKFLYPITQLSKTAAASIEGQKKDRSRALQVTAAAENQNKTKDYRACDASFLDCLNSDLCVECFLELQTHDVDWASVTSDTACSDVLEFLYKAKHCVSLKKDNDAVKFFCGTFDNCVIFDGDAGAGSDDEAEGSSDDYVDVDCSALTECKWPGFHQQFIGDGVCHDGMLGCYNTAICNWDGGDCCKDTCVERGTYNICGQDGFDCKNPNSTDCDPWLTMDCHSKKDEYKRDDDIINPDEMDCKAQTTLYRLVMYDSFGDGWDDTKIVLKQDGSNDLVYSGGLVKGSQGTQYICLNKSPTCYNVQVSGGVWGNEVSWEIKPYTAGAPPIAGGGAPQTCNFPVSGAPNCGNLCEGKPAVKPTNDPEYKDFKKLYTCITAKCPIQVGACQKDEVCNGCFSNNTTDFCYGIDTFNAVVDCTLCQCTEKNVSEFCSTKRTPGSIPDKKGDDKKNTPDPCSPAETLKGGNALIKFGQCTDLDQLRMMVTEFSQENFGSLDLFEACAHSFRNADNHGGHTARSCLRILVDAMNPAADYEPEDKKDDKKADLPVDAIAALATNLYHNASSFCACAKDASDNCPLCPSFHNFKTLLYESLDACQALDDIDCDAWEEFYRPCKNNIINQYKLVDFTKTEQCKYVHDGCGDAGPFPAFRKLDCDTEIPKAAWDFYKEYAGACLKDAVGPAPAPQPAPEPATPTPPPVAPQPEPAPNSKPSGKYVPPEERGKKSPSSSSSEDATPRKSGDKKKSHWFRNLFFLCLMGGAGYYWYKRQSDGFSFVRYRRARNYGDEDMIYSGLTMESSTTFEPPQLPPLPTAI